MKIGTLSLMMGLMLAWPALAGPAAPCPGPDTDSDGVADVCDNCATYPNAGQYDGDQDGYGDACDCDYSGSPNGVCDIGDFGQFVQKFNTLVPPTSCEFDMTPNGAVDIGDFGRFVQLFNGTPGPACGNPPGNPCPSPGAACP